MGLFCLLAFAVKDCPALGEVFRITGQLKRKGPLAVIQSKSLLAHSRLPQTVYSWVLNISETGVSTTSLSNLQQCLTTLTKKKGSFFLWMEFLVFMSVPIVSCPVSGHHREGLQLLYMPTRYPYTLVGYCCAGLLPSGLDFLIMGMMTLEQRGTDYWYY